MCMSLGHTGVQVGTPGAVLPSGETTLAPSDGEEVERVVIHEMLQYTKLQRKFSSVYQPSGQAIGFLFKTVDDRRRFERVVRREFAALSGSGDDAGGGKGGGWGPVPEWSLSENG